MRGSRYGRLPEGSTATAAPCIVLQGQGCRLRKTLRAAEELHRQKWAASTQHAAPRVRIAYFSDPNQTPHVSTKAGVPPELPETYV